MDDWNSRFGAAIRRGLERFCCESRLCGEVVSGEPAKPLRELKASEEDARLVECWRTAQLQAASQGVDVHTFLLDLGGGSDGELIESLSSRPRPRGKSSADPTEP